MGPKKGKGGKKKGKGGKKGDLLHGDPDEYKSFNVDQRQVLEQLYARMRELQLENAEVRAEVMIAQATKKEALMKNEGARDFYMKESTKLHEKIENQTTEITKIQKKMELELAEQEKQLMEKERDYKKKLDNLTAEQSNIMTDLSGQKNQELED